MVHFAPATVPGWQVFQMEVGDNVRGPHRAQAMPVVGWMTIRPAGDDVVVVPAVAGGNGGDVVPARARIDDVMWLGVYAPGEQPYDSTVQGAGARWLALCDRYDLVRGRLDELQAAEQQDVTP